MGIAQNLLAATHFNWGIDGTIVGIYLLATMVAGVMVRKYVGRVEDFLVAGREMNVYLGIASLAVTPELVPVTCATRPSGSLDTAAESMLSTSFGSQGSSTIIT